MTTWPIFSPLRFVIVTDFPAGFGKTMIPSSIWVSSVEDKHSVITIGGVKQLKALLEITASSPLIRYSQIFGILQTDSSELFFIVKCEIVAGSMFSIPISVTNEELSEMIRLSPIVTKDSKPASEPREEFSLMRK